MPRIKQQVDQFRVGIFHHPVDLLGRLHHGAHVVVEGQRHADLFGFGAQLIEPLAQRIPPRIV